MLEDYRQFGAPEAVIEEVRARLAPRTVEPVFSVHPDNGVAVKVLVSLASQWRTVALSTMTKATYVRTGLDYAALEPTARLTGLDMTPDDFGRLRVLEHECLAAWAEERRLGR